MLIKRNYLLLACVFGFSILSCTPNKLTKAGATGSSKIKSVKINQPDLKTEMKSSVSADDKNKVFDSLVYSINISASQKDGKDDCNTGVVPTKFDSGISPVSKSEFSDIKVNKGCNYLVSMKIGAKSDDGKAIKTVYLSSWDTKDPSILSKDELEKDKPNAAVKLYVTTEGKAYWDAESIVTPSDNDATINPSLVKPIKVSASAVDVNLSVKNELTGSVEVTPKTENSSEIYCAVGIIAELGNDTLTKKSFHIFKKKDKSFDEVALKIPASSTAKLTATGLSVTVPSELGLTNINSSEPYVYCDADKAKVELRYNECLVKETPTDSSVSCTETSIVK